MVIWRVKITKTYSTTPWIRISCLIKNYAIKTYWGIVGIYPRILNLGTRWSWVISFTPQPLYPRGKRPRHKLIRRPGGLQNRSGRGGEEKNFLSLPGFEHLIIQPVDQRYTTELSRLIILERILGKYGGKVWTECICQRNGPVACSCEHDNEPSDSIKAGKCFDFPVWTRWRWLPLSEIELPSSIL
jgi:hypothetical protein